MRPLQKSDTPTKKRASFLPVQSERLKRFLEFTVIHHRLIPETKFPNIIS